MAQAGRREMERTQFVANRAEEKRRGVQVLDTTALSRLPAEHQQREIDSMNEALEREAEQSKPPDGLTPAQYSKLIQMRTDGFAEERIREVMRGMKRAEVEEAKKHMTPAELQRMSERQQALLRDRYKPDSVVAERERELWDECASAPRPLPGGFATTLLVAVRAGGYSRGR